MTPRDRVGVIGIGIMGSAMAANLRRAGFAVIGHDIAPLRLDAFVRGGGTRARNARDVARRVPIIVTSLPSADALHQVAGGIASAAREGQVVIETSTLAITDKEAARAVLGAAGVTLLDCPLSGTGAQARTRDLVVYASGARAAYRRSVPAFEAFARSHHFLGAFGTGSKMKFLANLLVAIHNVSTAEALVLAARAGLDVALAVRVLGDGAGSSRMLQVRGPMMAQRRYRPATMKISTWQKDMKIIGEFASAAASPTPLFTTTRAIYDAAMAQGFAEADTASVFAVLERLAADHREG